MKMLSWVLGLLSVIGCSGPVALRAQTPAVSPELVGEWATEKSRFARGALQAGSALYLGPDGATAFVGAPPPIGIRGHATYDAANSRLTVTLFDDDDGGRPRQTIVLTHDRERGTLAMGSTPGRTEIFRRRSGSIPDAIQKDMEASKARAKAQADRNRRGNEITLGEERVISAWSAGRVRRVDVFLRRGRAFR
jgi:hypothetical protein